MDYPELVTVVAAIIAVIACGTFSIRLGYRRASREAAGQIRQEFQIRISKLRSEKRTRNGDS